jgi:hypothetical protein
MSSAEAARLDLYNRLLELLGPEHSATLMTFLPATPADQAVTKNDLDTAVSSLGPMFADIHAGFEQVDARFGRMEQRLDKLEQTLHDHIRLFVGTTVGAMTGLTAIYAFVISLIR